MLSIVLTLAIATAVPRKGPVSLTELCRFSDVIVVGRVERVTPIHRERQPSEDSGFSAYDALPAEVPVADVRVERVLKGPPGIEHVLYISTRRWTCDTIEANVGETAFFFFGDPSGEKALDEEFRRDVKAVLPNGELMTVLCSGDGRMPVHGKCVACTAYPVWNRPTVSAHDPHCSNAMMCVPFDWISEQIPAICAKQRAVWIRASVSAVRSESAGWDLELTGDRHVHLVLHGSDGDHAQEFLASARAVAFFENNVEWALKDSPSSQIGTGSDPLGDRHLEILGESRSFDVRIELLDDDWMRDPAHLKAARPSLGVWAEIRGLIDDPICADHRAGDKPWLDRRD